MHSDEYEIALSKEIKVCEGTIKRIRKTLELLEQKHHKTTEAFIEEYQKGGLASDADNQDDYRAWEDTFESLKRWLDLEQQYRQQFRVMKI
jgi:hypothetical protein